MNHNLQPYDENGETTGRRTIPWFRKHFMDSLNLIMKDVGRGSAIDVGCGNGRFNQIIKEFGFEFVSCMDPYETPDDRFFKEDGYENFSFNKCTLGKELIFRDVSKFDDKYDVAFFFGSPHILFKTYSNLGYMIKRTAKCAIMMFDVDDYWKFKCAFLDHSTSSSLSVNDETVLIKVVFK